MAWNGFFWKSDSKSDLMNSTLKESGVLVAMPVKHGHNSSSLDDQNDLGSKIRWPDGLAFTMDRWLRPFPRAAKSLK